MNEATVGEMADSTSTVNTLGALGSDGTVVRDRWNTVATVMLTGTDADPVYYVSKQHLHPWVMSKAQLGTDFHNESEWVQPMPIA